MIVTAIFTLPIRGNISQGQCADSAAALGIFGVFVSFWQKIIFLWSKVIQLHDDEFGSVSSKREYLFLITYVHC